MDNFVVSARKYRPATFDTVVGQEHVTQTLKNSIRLNHLAHAFLFCGPRGVGKTTCARILAKTINCLNISPDIEACNECESCQSFNTSGSFNIYELDAASNNSVDDIRGLVEQVRYAPQGAKYKIYIIDEVHMLSSSAFNAFLKTLEEPPPYAIFILATTEKHKILPTILSRCQIFDFKRIRIQDSVEHLKAICVKEGIEADEDALHVIAQKAEGALRDALSIFDRIVSFAGSRITYQDVISNLNILDYDYYFRILQMSHEQDLAASMLTFDEILDKGFDAHQFLVGISEHLRNLLMCKDPQTVKLLEVSGNVAQRYLEQAKIIPASFLLNGLNIVNQFDINFKSSKNQRLHVELCLMKLCYLQSLLTAKELVAQPAADKKKTDVKGAPPDKLRTGPQSDKEVLKSEAPEEVAALPVSTAPVSTPPVTTAAKTTAAPSATPKLGNLSSIRNKMAEQQAQQTPASINEEAVEPTALDADSFTASWQAYVQQVGSQSKPGLHAIYKMVQPTIDFNKVKLCVHKGELDRMEEDRLNLMAFLKDQLDNRSILIEIELIREEEQKNYAFTSGDKFKVMAEENTALHELKHKLGLEFD